MEGKLPAGSMMTGASYGAISLQGKMHMRQASMIHPRMCDAFPVPGNQFQDSDHQAGISIMEYNKEEHARASVRDDDEPS